MMDYILEWFNDNEWQPATSQVFHDLDSARQAMREIEKHGLHHFRIMTDSGQRIESSQQNT
jgi:predicted hydrolase (HD superfamily)